MNHQVFVHELIDPTDSSLLWLEDRGVIIRRGRPMWDFPPYPLSEDEMIERAQDCVALMGAGGNRITRRVIEAFRTAGTLP